MNDRVSDWSAPARQLADDERTNAEQPLSTDRITLAWRQRLQTLPAHEQHDAAALARELRSLRRWLIATLAWRDLAHDAPLVEIESAMTHFASLAIDALLPALVTDAERRMGRPLDADGQPIDLLVIGMGKLGAGELNVSSDIDLVLAIPCNGQAIQPGADMDHDALEFHAHVADRLATLLRTEVGRDFVFRVDTRLRPFGDVGPRVITLDALEHYFMAHGRFWERCAWLKARVVNAPVSMSAPAFSAACQRLDEMRQAFVFRRYTDYTTIDGLRDLAARIGEQRRAAQLKARATAAFGDADVKLGRGGIREIEFIAQGLAITHGGRNPWLRIPATRTLLTRLASSGRLDAEHAGFLDRAYVLLRRIEHAVQYVADRQTHAIPPGDAHRAQLAELMGFESLAAFDDALGTMRSRVAQLFDLILPAPLAARSTQLGTRTGETPSRILTWLTAANRESETTQRKLEAVLSAFDDRFAQDDAGNEAFTRAARLAQTIMKRRTYLDLLIAHPPVMDRVARLVQASPFAADYLTRHPILLDELIDPRIGSRGIDWTGFDAELDAQLGGELDTERHMNVLRDAHHAQVLRILALDLEGATPVEAISDELSLLADRLLARALDCAWRALKIDSPRPALAVLGYGRLGAKEMGYASDLDLVLVSDDAPDEVERLTRWTQRLQSWLSLATTSGRLFEVDLRLRPDGNAGLLVTPRSAFERYHETSALWEKQALTRARFVTGNAALGDWFETWRRRTLGAERDAAEVVREVSAMRRRVLEGHPNKTPDFDLKHDPGGLVDMEFAVQAMVLAHASRHPDLLENVGTLALAGRLGTHGLVPVEVEDAAREGYRTLRGLQHVLRLRGAEVARMAPDEAAAYRSAIRAFVAACGLAFPEAR
jgi:glutamate-ammonia-ligase adenylyltransferase